MGQRSFAARAAVFGLGAGLAVGLACAQPALAHHSYAMFDQSKELTLQGAVQEVQWTNPHAWILIKVPDAKGGSTTWQIEMGPPGTLVRGGWKRNTILPGHKVTVRLHPLRDGRAGGGIIALTGPDGHEYAHVVRPTPPGGDKPG